MNFLRNVIKHFQKSSVYDATVKENSNDFEKHTIEHSTSAVVQNANNIEDVMTSQSLYNGSENDNTIGVEFSSKNINVEGDIENIINISNNEETFKVFNEFLDFHSGNDVLVQNNKHDSEIELSFCKDDNSYMLEINDFEQVLKEFIIKGGDKFPKCGDVVDLNDRTTSNVLNEELNIDDFDKFSYTSNDSEENEVSNDNKSISEEQSILDINKKQLLKLRQFRKCEKYSDNKTPTHYFNTIIDSPNTEQTTAEYKQLHETQSNKKNNIKNFELQSDVMQTLTLDGNKSCVDTSFDIDLAIEHSRCTVDDTKSQNYSQGNEIKKIEDISIQNLTNDITNTCKRIEDSDHAEIISINYKNIADCKDGNKISKLDKDNIANDFVNERDSNITTCDNEPTDIETISLLSIEANIVNDDLDFCNGYHSSDFEFITESDAEIEGFITKTDEIKKSESKRVGTSGNASPNKDKPGSKKDFNDSQIPNYSTSNEYFHQPDASNSKTNTNFDNYNKTSNAVDYRQNYAKHSRLNHVIPQGNEYLNLFQGIYAPMFTDLFFLESKTGRAQRCMNVQYEGVGFDIRMASTEDSDEECKYRVQQNWLCYFKTFGIGNQTALTG